MMDQQAGMSDDFDALSTTSVGTFSKSFRKRARHRKPTHVRVVARVILNRVYESSFKSGRHSARKDASCQTLSDVVHRGTNTTSQLDDLRVIHLRTKACQLRLNVAALKGQVAELKRRRGIESDDDFDSISVEDENSSVLVGSDEEEEEEEELQDSSDYDDPRQRVEKDTDNRMVSEEALNLRIGRATDVLEAIRDGRCTGLDLFEKEIMSTLQRTLRAKNAPLNDRLRKALSVEIDEIMSAAFAFKNALT